MSSSGSRRWGEQTPAGVGEARERILDAAEVCLARSGYASITMDAVAAEAKISRATLYRYFADRDEVLSSVVLSHTERYLERIRFRVESQPDLGAAIIEFVLVTIKASDRDPTITGLFSSTGGEYAARVFAESSVELFEMVAEFFRPLFVRHAGDVRSGTTVEEGSEWILRTMVSLRTVPGPKRRGPSALDDFLARYLLPVIVE